MAGIQDALQLNGTTSVYVIGEEEGGAGEIDPRTFHTLQDHSAPAPNETVDQDQAQTWQE